MSVDCHGTQEQGIAHKDSGDGEKNILSRPEFDSFARWTEQSIRDLKDESKRLANATEYVSRDEFERFAQWTKESIRSLQEDNQRLRAKLEHRANVETTKVSPPMPVPSPSPTEARLVVAGGRRRSSPGITASAVALSCRSKHPSVCLPDLSEPACCGSLAYDGTTLLTLGGGSFRGGVASRKAEALLQESSKSWHWREIASMPSRRMAGCAHALAGGDVIACGGCDGDPSSAMSACDRLDVERNAWRESAPMLSNRAFAGSALASGALHLVGGFDGKRYLASCERFDPREGALLPPSHVGTGSIKRADARVAESLQGSGKRCLPWRNLVARTLWCARGREYTLLAASGGSHLSIRTPKCASNPSPMASKASAVTIGWSVVCGRRCLISGVGDGSRLAEKVPLG